MHALRLSAAVETHSLLEDDTKVHQPVLECNSISGMSLVALVPSLSM